MLRESLIPIYPIRDDVLVVIYDDGSHQIDIGGGKKIQLLVDTEFSDPRRNTVDQRHPGLRARWAYVVALSEYAKDTIGLKLGDKVLCDQLKWSRGCPVDNSGRRFWRIPADDILAIDDDGLDEDEAEKMRDWFERAGEDFDAICNSIPKG